VKYGVTTYLWSGDFTPATLSILPSIKAAGFDGVELPIFRPSEFDAPSVRRGLNAAGLDCVVSCVLTDGRSLATEDADLRRRSIEHLADVVKAAADTGARLVAGPLYTPVGYRPGRRSDGEWLRVVDAYRQLGPVLADHRVTIAIEPLNRFETHFLNTAADAVRLCAEIDHPNVGVLFDTFHANIEEKQVAGGLRTAAPYLKHVHISENDRGIPGTGHVPWPEVFAALRDIGYDGWVNIESFSATIADLSAATCIWRDLAPTPESIAFEGVGFLKGLSLSNGGERRERFLENGGTEATEVNGGEIV
jgi:D-psicose/D-tagatose/L-ribulose 3-epimerase